MAPCDLCLSLQRRTVRWITVREEVTTVTFLRELCAATPEARPTSAPACRAMWVTAGCVGVSSKSLLYQHCVLASANLELIFSVLTCVSISQRRIIHAVCVEGLYCTVCV